MANCAKEGAQGRGVGITGSSPKSMSVTSPPLLRPVLVPGTRAEGFASHSPRGKDGFLRPSFLKSLDRGSWSSLTGSYVGSVTKRAQQGDGVRCEWGTREGRMCKSNQVSPTDRSLPSPQRLASAPRPYLTLLKQGRASCLPSSLNVRPPTLPKREPANIPLTPDSDVPAITQEP